MMWSPAWKKGRSRMAKGKRAAALFEVIQAAKEREQLRTSKSGGFLTPSWWFKGKAKNGGERPAPAPVEPTERAPVEKPLSRATPAPLPGPILEPEPDSMKMVQPEAEVSEAPTTEP